MTTLLVHLIAGARPNFMKIAPIIRAIESRQEAGGPLRYRLIHTGQHYDQRMSGAFFDQLEIPPPSVNLQAGSGTQAEQTAAIMIGYERLLSTQRPAACLVVGDVTSTMATTITAQKAMVSVAHVEAGIRSGDWGMPEEINRRVTDSITNWFFTTTQQASENLLRQGVDEDQVFFVGNTMIDTLLAQMNRIQPPPFWHEEGVESGRFLLLTLHRPCNVDDAGQLGQILTMVASHARDARIVFPVHPRTANVLAKVGRVPENILMVEPQPYLEFIFLAKHCKAVITDSGGITEEATVLGIPCLTLRDTTERPETVDIGTNELLGTDPRTIGPALGRVFGGVWKKGSIPEKWDGLAAVRIVDHLEAVLGSGGTKHGSSTLGAE